MRRKDILHEQPLHLYYPERRGAHHGGCRPQGPEQSDQDNIQDDDQDRGDKRGSRSLLLPVGHRQRDEGGHDGDMLQALAQEKQE